MMPYWEITSPATYAVSLYSPRQECRATEKQLALGWQQRTDTMNKRDYLRSDPGP